MRASDARCRVDHQPSWSARHTVSRALVATSAESHWVTTLCCVLTYGVFHETTQFEHAESNTARRTAAQIPKGLALSPHSQLHLLTTSYSGWHLHHLPLPLNWVFLWMHCKWSVNTMLFDVWGVSTMKTGQDVAVTQHRWGWENMLHASTDQLEPSEQRSSSSAILLQDLTGMRDHSTNAHLVASFPAGVPREATSAGLIFPGTWCHCLGKILLAIGQSDYRSWSETCDSLT